MPLHYHDSALGYVIKFAIAIEVVADGCIFRHTNVLIKDCPTHTRPPSDIAVIEENRLLHQRAGMHLYPPAQNGVAHHPARKNRAARDNRIDGLPAAALLVENELRGRIGVAGGPERPLAIVKV